MTASSSDLPESMAPTHMGFPMTPWTMLGISAGADPAGERAMAQLCQMYWAPLYAWLRRTGVAPGEAEDLTQGFFLHLLEKSVLQKAAAERGRLRSFLIGALKNFVRGEDRKERTGKRGGKLVTTVLTEHMEAQLSDPGLAGESPDQIFERRWAVSVLGHTLAQLKEEEERNGRGAAFAILSDAMVRSRSENTRAEMAKALGMTENAAAVALHRLRKRCQAVFRAQVAATVGSEAEVEDEIIHLRQLFLKG